MNYLISIIIPVYNVEAYLQRCVESAINQLYRNIEIILVDDGSTDGSGRLCDEFSKTDKRIKVLHKTNGGLSSARNAGLEIARGEYIGFLDSDDWIEPEMYSKMIREITRTRCPIVCCGRYDVDSKTMIRRIGLCPAESEVISGEEAVKRLLTWRGMDSSAVDKLFHCKLLKKFRFPEGKINEDVAVMYRILLHANTIAMVPIPLYNYFHREKSITTSSFNPKKLDILEHAENIIAYLKIEYPNLVIYAEYFRFITGRNIYNMIIRDNASDNEEYPKLLRQLGQELNQLYPEVKRLDSQIADIGSCLKTHMMPYPLLYTMLYRIKLLIKNR